MNGGPLSEAPRKRRAYYSSGRKEVIGFGGNPFKRKTRKSPKKSTSASIDRSPFRSNFRWKK